MTRNPTRARSRTAPSSGPYGPHQREVRVTVTTALILILVLAVAMVLSSGP